MWVSLRFCCDARNRGLHTSILRLLDAKRVVKVLEILYCGRLNILGNFLVRVLANHRPILLEAPRGPM